MTSWVLQNNIFNEPAYDRLLGTLARFNIPTYERRVVPFAGVTFPLDYEGVVNEDYVDHELVDLGWNVICFGSYSMRHVAAKHSWRPGVFDLGVIANFEICLKHWGDLMLNSDSQVVRFEDASWPCAETRFVRPTDDTKSFAGQLFTGDEFYGWQRGVAGLHSRDLQLTTITPDTLVQVARPKKIYAEYRCWVVKKKIVTMSLYKRGRTVIYQNMDDGLGDEARAFADSVLSHGNTARLGNNAWQPHQAFCLDVCQTEDGWRVVEVNTINSSGFYAADLTKLVLTLENEFDDR